MTVETLERLGTELVRLCDGVEKFGLVDYQSGVAEDEIITCEQMISSLSRLRSSAAD